MAVVCPKPRGREGRFWTPQPQIVVCLWVEKGFLAYFYNVLLCLTAFRLMPGNCSVSGLRHRPPSSQLSRWKCREIKVKLAPTCSPVTVTGPLKVWLALCLKVSRGKELEFFSETGKGLSYSSWRHSVLQDW